MPDRLRQTFCIQIPAKLVRNDGLRHAKMVSEKSKMIGFSSCIVMKARRIVITTAIVTLFGAVAARIESASAAQNPEAQAQSSAADKNAKVNEKRVSEGEAYAKQLLMLMDRDQNGKVSHAEFTNFMEAEFQMLDVNKDGELDVKELTKTRLFHGGGHR
jgi:hypothetical protein